MAAVSPLLIVTDVERTISFYCKRLGFEATLRQPDARPFFAIIRRDGVQLMIKSHQNIAPLPNSKRMPWTRWDAFVYSEDPDGLYKEMLERDATVSAPLSDTHDGLRGFEITDPDGHAMFFGRPR
jgi:uncharacterized glyoxalase superfamily protein PhnB